MQQMQPNATTIMWYNYNVKRYHMMKYCKIGTAGTTAIWYHYSGQSKPPTNNFISKPIRIAQSVWAFLLPERRCLNGKDDNQRTRVVRADGNQLAESLWIGKIEGFSEDSHWHKNSYPGGCVQRMACENGEQKLNGRNIEKEGCDAFM